MDPVLKGIELRWRKTTSFLRPALLTNACSTFSPPPHPALSPGGEGIETAPSPSERERVGVRVAPLDVAPGDYLEVAVERGKVVMTPKALVDKRLEKRLAESYEDFRKGRASGPFSSAKAAIEALDAPKKRKKTKAS